MGTKRGNHEGSIYKRKDGRWEGALSLEGGKRKRFYGKTRQDASQKLAEALRDRDKGLPSVNERHTLASHLARWLDATKVTVRPSTWLRYEQYCRVHILPALGKKALSRLTPQDLQTFYAEKLAAGLSPTTVMHLHAVLHRVLHQAVRWGSAVRNVATLVDSPRRLRREMTTLSPEQARAFLTAIVGQRLEALYVLALTTGMRQGELLALRWRDVDMTHRTAQVTATLHQGPVGPRFAEPKTPRSRRQITLGTAAAEALRSHRARQLEERLRLGPSWADLDLIFTDEVGQPLDGKHLTRRFYPLLAEAGLPRIRFHDLRHTAATLLLGQGVHPKLVAEMLGHTQIAVTLDLYSHVTPTMHRQAADTMDAVVRG